MNSLAAVNTRVAGGSEAATRPSTDDTGAPINDAKAARAVSTAASNSAGSAPPVAHLSTDWRTASTTARGGTPIEGVLT